MASTNTAPAKTLKLKKPDTTSVSVPEALRSKVAAILPKEVHANYIGRKFHGKSEFQIFDYALENHRNVLIEGPTGPGKTTAVMAFAALKEMHFYAVSSNIGIDPSQLFGKYIPDEAAPGAFIWQDGPVTDLVRHGGVLLINEVNFLPPRVATVLFSLLDTRRSITLMDHKGETINAHDNLVVMADMNPDYAGTITLNAAFRNRFAIQLEWGYDNNVESQLVKSAALLDVANRLRKQVNSGEVSTPVSTNMLMEFEKIAEGLGIDFAVQNFVSHFGMDDRPSIKQTLDAATANIRQDYAPTKSDVGRAKPDENWDFAADTSSWIYGESDDDDEEGE